MVSLAEAKNILDGIAGPKGQAMSYLGTVSQNFSIRPFLIVLALAVAAMIIIEARKGVEERRKVYGLIILEVFLLSVIFGSQLMIMAYVLLGILTFHLVQSFRNGDSKGAFLSIVLFWLLSLLVSLNIIMMLVMLAGGAVLLRFILKSAFERIYGTSAAARIANEEGYPVAKERKILRGLSRIARRGYSWSKDKMLRGMGKLKQRFAERELANLAEQEHEAEMAAAEKKAAESIESLEKDEARIDEKDMTYIIEILKQCENLKRHMQGLSPDSVDEQKKKDIISTSKVVLTLSHKLVEDKLEEESLRDKAGKNLEQCMSAIQSAAKEARQLKETRSEFNEIRKTADKSIKAIKREIQQNERSLEKACKEAASSKAEGAKSREKMLVERHNLLADVDKKLSEIDSYIKSIMIKLAAVNAKENVALQSVAGIEQNAEKHRLKLAEFKRQFERADKKLRNEHSQFEHMFKKEMVEIPDAELTTLADSTILIFQHLKEISDAAYRYNANELKPIISDMANVARKLFYLSKVSEYLSKMYYRLSQAMEELDKMAAIVDQNPESKNKLSKILQAEQIEEQLSKRGFQKGKAIMSHIKQGYATLVEANGYTDKHIIMLQKYSTMVDSAKREIGITLNDAFRIVLKQQISQAKKLVQEAKLAEEELRKAKIFEKGAAQAAGRT